MTMKTERRMLAVIRSEDERLLRSLQEEEGEDVDGEEGFAYDVYVAHEAPLIAELCLSLLVVVHHQVERELVRMAATVGSPDDEPLSLDAYREAVEDAREVYWKDKKKIFRKLKIAASQFPAWDKSIQTLRLLANCYKHDPYGRPEPELLEHLKLPLSLERRTTEYAHLALSDLFRQGLARSLNMEWNVGYPDITEALIGEAEAFITAVEANSTFRKVRFGMRFLA